jgi:alginate O-acetyltransferase complex protein AlgI
VGVGLLGVFKYADFFIDSFNATTGLSLPLLRLALPIGISFYTFQSLSYTIDVYRGNVPVQKNIISFGAYVTLFPQLIAGPIVRYSDVERQLEHRIYTSERIASGITVFSVGLAKKVLLGDGAAAAFRYFSAAAGFEHTALGAWMTVICYTLHIYYDFSGYSDMAIGLGMMFGFKFPENFNYPYISRSITEFWRRWHITLSTWFREYVYIPLGGNRKGKARQYLNLAAVWLLTGLWHGASWNFVLWGAYFLVILVIEKAFLLKAFEKVPRVLTHAYALLLIGIGWIIFAFPNLSEGWAIFTGMFGIGTVGFASPVALYEALRYLPLLIVCFVGVTPLPKQLFEKIKDKPLVAYTTPVACALLLVLCTAYLVDSTFSPFLYYIF